MKSYPKNKVYIPAYKGLLDEAPLNVENLRLCLTVYAMHTRNLVNLNAYICNKYDATCCASAYTLYALHSSLAQRLLSNLVY